MNPATKKYSLWLIIFLVYIGLPISILFDVIGFEYKFYALTVGGFATYAIFRLLGFSNEDMGITSKQWGKSILHVLPVTVVLLIIGAAIYFSGYSRIIPNETWNFFIFYIFISSPIQEFLYRGALTVSLERQNIRPIGVMLISTLLYSFAHIIYKDWLTLLLTFFIGLIWYASYQKSKNLIGVSISHAVLGVITIIAGVIG